MIPPPPPSRKPNFVVGGKYLVQRSFDCPPNQHFVVGQRVIFVKEGYSSYDEAVMYVFREVVTGKELVWWPGADVPADIWDQLFLLVV